MDIKILQLIEGAKQATGLTVVIDVFRAFTTACFIINNKAEAIYPVGKVETAFKLKREFPKCVLVGERNEVIVPGFDYGNSPSNIEHIDFSGKTVIHTTSAGTQGIVNAVGADEIITASFVNIFAVVRYIKHKNPDIVSIVCMGKAAKEPAEEDTWCAEYIRALLLDEGYDINDRIIKLRSLEGKRFFRPDNQEQCPERDFYLSTQLGIFDFILKAEKFREVYRLKKIVI
ncbi:putative 2-phosphosulfolactate phosphatase [Clostridiales bacterium]|nr:putative 2-phosphosulfolactate phosphatase [Clostridiales bacterium]